MKNLFFGTNLEVTRGGRRLAKNLEFKIESGGILLLNGENGSGKSTLLRIMAGLSRPTSGKIYWNNDDVHDNLSEHFERMIFVGHSTAIKSNLTVKENLKYWQKIHLEDKDKRGHLEHSLDIFNLTNSSNSPARFLSSGQSRKLALARLMLKPASLWLLDEPTVGLDAAALRSLLTLLNNHCERGGIVVMASHDEVRAECPVQILKTDNCKKG